MKIDASNALKSLFRKTLLASLLLSFIQCTETYQPKPHGYFRIALPGTQYHALQTTCPYSFMLNNDATFVPKKYCWADVRYPSIKANIQLTYKSIKNKQHLDTLLAESQSLAYKHSVKAQGIGEKLYTNPAQNKYGLLYSMQGNAASSTQFFVTDSNTHFLRGVLYFYSVPNADSLKPVNEYMQNQVVHLIETLQWKNSLP